MKKKILIVDDEKDLREILNYNLGKSGYSILEAHNGDEAIDICNKEKLDLIILDIMMPGKDGYEVCRILRSKGNRTPIIFLTAKDTEFDEVLGLELGADDYVKKPFSTKALISRIRSIFRRLEEDQKTNNILKIQGLVINIENYEVYIDNQPEFFPKKEFELLTYLASHPNKVFSRDFLLDEVWKEDSFVVDRTIDVHIGRIRKKLGNYKQLIKTIVGVGYRFQA